MRNAGVHLGADQRRQGVSMGADWADPGRLQAADWADERPPDVTTGIRQIQDGSEGRIGQREDWADWAHGRGMGTDSWQRF